MEIQWFPGHMYRAKKALEDIIKQIDIVIELLDARAPHSSSNPLLNNITKYKKKIKILNKSDLADPQVTNKWIIYFKIRNILALTNSKDNLKIKLELIKQCKKLAPNRNSFEKPLRVMITGIPNVGKSTLINILLNKKATKVADIPAVTRSIQILNLTDDFLIYDTPGLTWEKFDNPLTGFNLAICNAIGRNALDEELIVEYLLNYLKNNYPKALILRYKLNELDLKDNTLNIIGKKRGAIISGGIIDKQKISQIILKDFRDGKLGPITLEHPLNIENLC